jgi:hypothetical protein
MTLGNDSYYLFFQNMSQVNGIKGFVGYGIRELNESEKNSFCLNNSSMNNVMSPPLVQNQVNFTSDFLLRTYTSGCYYYDSNTGKWFSDGLSIEKDTNIRQTHCSSYHLTSFAGGLVVMPNNINFQYVFANASFSKNYTIYLTLICVVILYLSFALWAFVMDIRDFNKLHIILLKDNNPTDDYFYELIVFTGNCSESGTHSTV